MDAGATPGREAAASDAALIAHCQAILGPGAVLTDERSRALFSQDVYRSGAMPLAILQPSTIVELQAVVAAATGAGIAVFPRGGGMSYTDAFLPATTRAVIVDTRRLDRVLEINTVDLYATVESGITWSALDAALAPHGVRALFWGPMSGRLATVGGACSQGAVTYGSGRHGVSGQSVLGFDVVLADGRRLRTGSGGQAGHAPFFRHAGPDLTGVFAADGGALGIKAEVTLALEPRPGAGDGIAFAFEDFRALHAAVTRIARENLATEVFGAESALVRLVAGPPDLRADLRTMHSILRAQHNPLAGISRVLRLAMAGRRSLGRARYLVNVMTEGADRKAVGVALGDIRRIVGRSGIETTNVVPTITRTTPFPDPMVLGPGGRRLLPLHGIFPPSRVLDFHDAMLEFRGRWQSRLDTEGMLLPVVYATVGRGGFLYEPVIYWPDSWPELHRQVMPPAVLATLRAAPANPVARALVEELRAGITQLMFDHGAVHLQIGRTYPFLRDRDPAFLELLRAVKARLDPAGLMNPGVLGL